MSSAKDCSTWVWFGEIFGLVKIWFGEIFGLVEIWFGEILSGHPGEFLVW